MKNFLLLSAVLALLAVQPIATHAVEYVDVFFAMWPDAPSESLQGI